MQRRVIVGDSPHLNARIFPYALLERVELLQVGHLHEDRVNAFFEADLHWGHLFIEGNVVIIQRELLIDI
ncbi:hypothetical protein FGO68_gene11913 [Halteria grandinella]|uniref:Uncharacterized protein n=1 Tax=Halteria grandinella TaxID=5974 RepID=A0A8J8NFP9_HALGN|nr:hypothetical protein FGO68_gene11913 [Halteria grandinella]